MAAARDTSDQLLCGEERAAQCRPSTVGRERSVPGLSLRGRRVEDRAARMRRNQPLYVDEPGTQGRTSTIRRDQGSSRGCHSAGGSPQLSGASRNSPASAGNRCTALSGVGGSARSGCAEERSDEGSACVARVGRIVRFARCSGVRGGRWCRSGGLRRFGLGRRRTRGSGGR